MDKRTFLAIVLSLIVILTWQVFFAKKPPPKQPEPTQQETPVAGKPAVKETARAQFTPSQTKTVLSQKVAGSEKDITVVTPLFTAIFTTKGGSLKSYKLKEYRTALDSTSDPVDLVHLMDGMQRPFTVTFPESNVDILPESIFTTDRGSIDLTQSPDNHRLTFTQTYPDKMKIEKIFTFYPEKYAFDCEVKVHNLSKTALGQNPLLSWHQYVDPKAETDSYGHDGPISFIAKDVELYDVKKIDSGKLLGPDVAWAGFESKYFIASIIPQNPTLTSLSLSVDAQNMVSVSLKGTQNIIPPGQIGSFSYSLYLGPKEHDILKSQGVGLENAIDFGSWMKWLAMPCLSPLNFSTDYVSQLWHCHYHTDHPDQDSVLASGE